MNAAVERFLEYVTYDTASNHDSDTCPSTKGQRTFGRALLKECKRLGFDSVNISDSGYIYCFLKGSGNGSKSVGFIAHMDTSPDFSGRNVKPNIIKYSGGEIMLNDLITMNPQRFPNLNRHIGHDLITTDGTTLLGADDKAGIAEILTAIEYIIANEIEHPDIYVSFTPDEEIGRGMDNFDLTMFRPDFAYTVDGGIAGELEYECFNAARANIFIKGESVHPGYAKGIMKNAALLAAELAGKLPSMEIPAETEGYEGFFHVNSINADVGAAKIVVLVRDFEKDGFLKRKELLTSIAAEMNEKYVGRIRLEIKDEYLNMKGIIAMDSVAVEVAKGAYEAAGIQPLIRPIRGGTDGSRLSFMGIPCPNIFAGGCNFHGPYEYISVQSMSKAVSVIVNIIRMTGELR